MPIPYRTLSDDTLNLSAESGDAQALMELGYRAKRGELIVIPVTISYMSLRDGLHERTAYRVERVTSVRRDGTAQARESLITGTPSKGVVYGQMVVKGIDVERASRAIVERGSDEFESLEDVREFLRPFKENEEAATEED